MGIIYVIIFAFCNVETIYAQGELEDVFENSESDGYNNSQIEAIEYYRNNPLDLSKADPEKLLRLKVLSLSDARRIYSFVSEHQDFNYDMITDSLNMPAETKFILENCTYYRYKPQSNALNVDIRSMYKTVLQEKDGFEREKYLGSPIDLSNRISITNGNFESGILADKNEGEVSYYETLSGYAAYENKDFYVIAGDFNLDIAGGSLFSGAFGKRKMASSAADVIFLGNGISPNRSTMEQGLFRGAAASANLYSSFGKIRISPFYSNISRGATVNENKTITSIYSSGYYRTETEISKKNMLREVLTGFDVRISKMNLIYGFTAYYLNYDKEVITSAQSSFSGKNGIFGSSYLYYDVRDNYFNLELSFDANRNESLIFNYENILQNSKFAFNFRHISPDFRSNFGNILSENSYIANETGIYSGFESKFDNMRINFYADLYKTYKPTYFIPMPVKGLDIMSEIDYKIDSYQDIVIRVKSENKSDAYKDDIINAKTIRELTKNYLRIDYSAKINKSYSMRIRYENTFNNSKHNNESGNLAFYELKYSGDKISSNARISYYDTDSYDSAIWLFEYAVPGYITTVPLYGQGVRFTFGLNYSIFENFNLRMRFASTIKNNTSKIGSGYESIQGNKRSDLILQLNYSY